MWSFKFWMLINAFMTFFTNDPALGWMIVVNILVCLLFDVIDIRKTKEKEELIKHGQVRTKTDK